jgi:phenolic acid decarboxylase
MDKSAIYAGGVLQMFFGIYGSRWLKEKPEILRIYMNNHWSRPSENEKPNGHNNIENGCYW